MGAAIVVGLIAFLLPGLVLGLLAWTIRLILLAALVVKWAAIAIFCALAFLWFMAFDRETARRIWREGNAAGLSARRAAL